MKKVLIAYFSWSGNTKEIAKQIHQFMGGDVFEIQRAEDYPAIYNAVLDMTKKEIRTGIKPGLKHMPASIDEYDCIFIGYPNWWSTYPAPVSTFLSAFDFSAKTIIPFCTHGGGGIEQSVSNIEKQCSGAKVLHALSINGNAVRNCNKELENYLKTKYQIAVDSNRK